MGMRSLPILRGLAEEAQACDRFNESRHFCRPAARHGLSPASPTYGCSAYRHDVAVPGLIDGGCRQAAGGCLLDMFTPPGHHRAPAFDVIRPVVGASNFVFIDMR